MQNGNADIMQPGLLSLQPSLEEIMASLSQSSPQSIFRASKSILLQNLMQSAFPYVKQQFFDIFLIFTIVILQRKKLGIKKLFNR